MILNQRARINERHTIAIYEWNTVFYVTNSNEQFFIFFSTDFRFVLNFLSNLIIFVKKEILRDDERKNVSCNSPPKLVAETVATRPQPSINDSMSLAQHICSDFSCVCMKHSKRFFFLQIYILFERNIYIIMISFIHRIGISQNSKKNKMFSKCVHTNSR